MMVLTGAHCGCLTWTRVIRQKNGIDLGIDMLFTRYLTNGIAKRARAHLLPPSLPLTSCNSFLRLMNVAEQNLDIS